MTILFILWMNILNLKKTNIFIYEMDWYLQVWHMKQIC